MVARSVLAVKLIPRSKLLNRRVLSANTKSREATSAEPSSPRPGYSGGGGGRGEGARSGPGGRGRRQRPAPTRAARRRGAERLTYSLEQRVHTASTRPAVHAGHA